MKRLILLAALLLTTTADALTSISVRKVYGREVYTIADKTADDQFFVDAINAAYAYFPGTDSLKIVYVVTDYLKGKAGRTVQLATTETLRVPHARLTETTLDSLKGVPGTNTTPLQDTVRVHNITVAFTGGGSWKSRVYGIDSLEAAIAKIDSLKADLKTKAGVTVSAYAIDGDTINVDSLTLSAAGKLTAVAGTSVVVAAIDADSLLGAVRATGLITAAAGLTAPAGQTVTAGAVDADTLKSGVRIEGTAAFTGPVTSALAPVFSGGATSSSLNITGKTTLGDAAGDTTISKKTRAVSLHVGGTTDPDSTAQVTGGGHFTGGLKVDGSTIGLGQHLIGTSTASAFAAGPSLLIAQGMNDDNAIVLQSDDVAAVASAMADAKTYGQLRKFSDVAGGLFVRGFRDSGGDPWLSLVLEGTLGEAASTTKSTASYGIVDIAAFTADGTNQAVVGTNGNMVSMRNGSTTAWLLDAEGDTWQTGGLTFGARVLPSADATISFGSTAASLDSAYIMDVVTGADIPFLDNEDDVAAICAIKVHPDSLRDARGRLLVDDNTLPKSIMLIYTEDQMDTVVANIVTRTDTVSVDTLWEDRTVPDSSKVVSYTVKVDSLGVASEAEPIYETRTEKVVKELRPVTQTVRVSADTTLVPHAAGDLILTASGKPMYSLSPAIGQLQGAIRQLAAVDDSLRGRIEALEGQNADILARLAKLEAR